MNVIYSDFQNIIVKSQYQTLQSKYEQIFNFKIKNRWWIFI